MENVVLFMNLANAWASVRKCLAKTEDSLEEGSNVNYITQTIRSNYITHVFI